MTTYERCDMGKPPARVRGTFMGHSALSVMTSGGLKPLFKWGKISLFGEKSFIILSSISSSSVCTSAHFSSYVTFDQLFLPPSRDLWYRRVPLVREAHRGHKLFPSCVKKEVRQIRIHPE